MTGYRARTAAADMDSSERSAQAADAEFEQIFKREYPRVLNALVRLLGDDAEAQDLALETFWRLHRNPPHRERGENAGGWLHRVAINLGLNALRARGRRQRYELEAGRASLNENDAADPALAFAAEEERARVRTTLAQMNPRQAELLLLRHSGMAYQELASVLGLSPNSIGTLLARAEREFEKRYGELEQ